MKTEKNCWTVLLCVCICLFLGRASSQQPQVPNIEVLVTRPEHIIQIPKDGIIHVAVEIHNNTDQEVRLRDDTGIYRGVYLYEIEADGNRKAIFPFDPASYAKRVLIIGRSIHKIAAGKTLLLDFPLPNSFINLNLTKSLQFGVTGSVLPKDGTTSNTSSTQNFFSRPFNFSDK